MAALLFIALVFVAVETKSFSPDHAQTGQKRADSVCYGDLGCFTTDPPFSSEDRTLADLPKSPADIQTKFEFFSKETPTNAQNLDGSHPENSGTAWPHFTNRPTKFIVHGFLNNPDSNPWLSDMKNELLKAGDFNVIIVSWASGNKPPYTQATANTRVVGAQIALLIKQLIKTKGVAASSFHIIGHSLGAHVAGYAGERVPGLGRITGLDPAGPEFDNTDITVRLDPTDAAFVDIIHTDSKNLIHLGFGTLDEDGDADFYPNLGHDQPGCSRSPFVEIAEWGFTQGLKEVVACNHFRSIKFFTESINSQCQFVAYPCNSADDFTNNKCKTCPSGGCPSMGFKADQHKPPSGSHVKYYLTTASLPPFCEYHLDLTFKFSASLGKATSGRLQVTIHGDAGSTEQLYAAGNDTAFTITPGSTYNFKVGAPSNIGKIQSLTFTWDHHSSLLDPSDWNLFGLAHPTVFLDEVDVQNEESNSSVRFCVNKTGVQTGNDLDISAKC